MIPTASSSNPLLPQNIAMKRLRQSQVWAGPYYLPTKKTLKIALPIIVILGLTFLTLFEGGIEIVLWRSRNRGLEIISGGLITYTALFAIVFASLWAKSTVHRFILYKNPEWQKAMIDRLRKADLHSLAERNQCLCYSFSEFSDYEDSGLLSKEDAKHVWKFVKRYQEKKKHHCQNDVLDVISERWDTFRDELVWPNIAAAASDQKVRQWV